ncbi:hypothetical protein KIPB_000298 [Kipferlia bialata]|uniref:Uncharacterized protein n=1 Tax=Kipferlia bialata TaxID=797122 RepID=A0A9K3CP12_9EUKA|nr:hypothetical protein KIPB_000298 [Kipferlia bialata]|eukprot:g298.t1
MLGRSVSLGLRDAWTQEVVMGAPCTSGTCTSQPGGHALLSEKWVSVSHQYVPSYDGDTAEIGIAVTSSGEDVTDADVSLLPSRYSQDGEIPLSYDANTGHYSPATSAVLDTSRSYTVRVGMSLSPYRYAIGSWGGDEVTPIYHGRSITQMTSLRTIESTVADGVSEHKLGMAVWGDWLALGSPSWGGRGRVQIYSRHHTTAWGCVDTFTDPGAVAGARFGEAIAMTDGVLVVGAPGRDGTGATIVYYLDDAGTSWTMDTTNPWVDGPSGAAEFGGAIDMQGSVMVSCSSGYDSNKGKCTKYSWDSTSHSMTMLGDIMPGTSPSADTYFGTSVAIDPIQGHVAVGLVNNDGADRKCYIFDESGIEHSITAPGGVRGFANALAIYDGKIAIGAPNARTNAGSIFIYSYQSYSVTPYWTGPIQTIKDPATYHYFGRYIALYNEYMFVVTNYAYRMVVFKWDSTIDNYAVVHNVLETDLTYGTYGLTVDSSVAHGDGQGYGIVYHRSGGTGSNTVDMLRSDTMLQWGDGYVPGYGPHFTYLQDMHGDAVIGVQVAGQAVAPGGDTTAIYLGVDGGYGQYTSDTSVHIPHGSSVSLNVLYYTAGSTATISANTDAAPLREASVSIPLASVYGQAHITSGRPVDSLAIHGDWVIVGRTYGYGSVKCMNKNVNSYAVETLLMSTPSSVSKFGCAVAFNGVYLAVGAKGFSPGNVYVYKVTWDNQWIWHQTLNPGEAGMPDLFGTAIEMEGDTMVVGAPGYGNGNAYVYGIEDGIWVLSHTISGAAATEGGFGCKLALSADASTLAVSTCPGGGVWSSVRVFERYPGGYSAGAWAQTYVTPIPDTYEAEYISLAVSSTFMVVGVPTITSSTLSEVVYIEKQSGSWGEFDSFDKDGIEYGAAVALLDGAVLIGSPGQEYAGVSRGMVTYTPSPDKSVTYSVTTRGFDTVGSDFGRHIAVDHTNKRVAVCGLYSTGRPFFPVLESVDVYVDATPVTSEPGLIDYSVEITDSTSSPVTGLSVVSHFDSVDGFTRESGLVYSSDEGAYTGTVFGNTAGTISAYVGVSGFLGTTLAASWNEPHEIQTSVTTVGTPTSCVVDQMLYDMSDDIYITILNAQGYPVCGGALTLNVAWTDGTGSGFTPVYDAATCKWKGTQHYPGAGTHSLSVAVAGVAETLLCPVEVAMQASAAGSAAVDSLRLPYLGETDVCVYTTDENGIANLGNLSLLEASLASGSASSVTWNGARQCFEDTVKAEAVGTEALTLFNNYSTVDVFQMETVVLQQHQSLFEYEKTSGNYTTALDEGWAAVGGDAIEGVTLYKAGTNNYFEEYGSLDVYVAGGDPSADIAYQVAMSNGYLAVGRCVLSGDTVSHVLLFQLEDGEYKRKQEISGSAAGMYGCSLALSPRLLAVGAYLESGASTTGVVRTYEYFPTYDSWYKTSTLEGSVATEFFGYRLATEDIYDGTIHHRLVVATNSYYSYLYQKIGGTWTYVTAFNQGTDVTTHGVAVSMDGGIVAVAEIVDATYGVFVQFYDVSTGSAVYHRTGTVGGDQYFSGASLALSGTTIAIGCSPTGRTDPGSVTFNVLRSTDRFYNTVRVSHSDSTLASTEAFSSVAMYRDVILNAGVYPTATTGLVAIYESGPYLSYSIISGTPLYAGYQTVRVRLYDSTDTVVTTDGVNDREYPLYAMVTGYEYERMVMVYEGSGTYAVSMYLPPDSQLTVSAMQTDSIMPVLQRAGALYLNSGTTQITSIVEGSPVSVEANPLMIGHSVIELWLLNVNGHVNTTEQTVSIDIGSSCSFDSSTFMYTCTLTTVMSLVGDSTATVTVNAGNLTLSYSVNSTPVDHTLHYDSLIVGSPVPVCVALVDSSDRPVFQAFSVSLNVVGTASDWYSTVYDADQKMFCTDVTMDDAVGTITVIAGTYTSSAESVVAYYPFSNLRSVPVDSLPSGYEASSTFGTVTAMTLPYMAISDPDTDAVHIFKYDKDTSASPVYVQSMYPGAGGVGSGVSGFGTSLAMADDILVIGQADTVGTDDSAVLIYTLDTDSNTFSLNSTLYPSRALSGLPENAGYGQTIALYYDDSVFRLAVGAAIAAPVVMYESNDLGVPAPTVLASSHGDVLVTTIVFSSGTSLVIGREDGGRLYPYTYEAVTGAYMQWVEGASNGWYAGLGAQGLASSPKCLGCEVKLVYRYDVDVEAGTTAVWADVQPSGSGVDIDWGMASRISTDGQYIALSTNDPESTDTSNNVVHIATPRSSLGGDYERVVDVGMFLNGVLNPDPLHRFGESVSLDRAHLLIGSPLAIGTMFAGHAFLATPGTSLPVSIVPDSTWTLTTREHTTLSFHLTDASGATIIHAPYRYVPQFAHFNDIYYPVQSHRDGRYSVSLMGPSTADTYTLTLMGGRVTDLSLTSSITVSGSDYAMTASHAVVTSFDYDAADANMARALIASDAEVTVAVYAGISSETSELHSYGFVGGEMLKTVVSNWPWAHEAAEVDGGYLYLGLPVANSVMVVPVSATGFGTLETTITLPDSPGSDSSFGRNISVCGNYMAIQGNAHMYFYIRENGVWMYSSYISYGAGYDVTNAQILGRTLMFVSHEDGVAGGGVVHLYRLYADYAGWELITTVPHPWGSADVRFGTALALDVETLAVSATEADGSSSVYVFEIIGRAVLHRNTITSLIGSLGTSTDSGFGTSIAMSGGRLLVSSPNEAYWSADAAYTNPGAALLYTSPMSDSYPAQTWYGNKDTGLSQVTLNGGYAVAMGFASHRGIHFYVPTRSPTGASITFDGAITPLAPTDITVQCQVDGVAADREEYGVRVCTDNDNRETACVWSASATAHKCRIMAPRGAFNLRVMHADIQLANSAFGVDVPGLVQHGMYLSSVYGDSCLSGDLGTPAAGVTSDGNISAYIRPETNTIELYEYDGDAQQYGLAQSITETDISHASVLSPWSLVTVDPDTADGTIHGLGKIHIYGTYNFDLGASWLEYISIDGRIQDLYPGERGVIGGGRRTGYLCGDADNSLLVLRHSGSVYGVDSLHHNVTSAYLEEYNLITTSSSTTDLTLYRSDGTGTVTTEVVTLGSSGCTIVSVKRSWILVRCSTGNNLYTLALVKRPAIGSMFIFAEGSDIPASNGAIYSSSMVYVGDGSDTRYGPDSGVIREYEKVGSVLVPTGNDMYSRDPNGSSGLFVGDVYYGGMFMHVRGVGLEAGKGVAVYGPRLVPHSMATSSVSARPGMTLSVDLGLLSSSDGRAITGVFKLFARVGEAETECVYSGGSYSVPVTAPRVSGTYPVFVGARDCAEVSMSFDLVVAGDPVPRQSRTTLVHSTDAMSIELGGEPGDGAFVGETVSGSWDGATPVSASDEGDSLYTLSLTTPTTPGAHTCTVEVNGERVVEDWVVMQDGGMVQTGKVTYFA